MKTAGTPRRALSLVSKGVVGAGPVLFGVSEAWQTGGGGAGHPQPHADPRTHQASSDAEPAP